MHSNRSTRNAQQVRSIIQNMGRSIDEARNRRLGPPAPQTPNAPPARNEPAPKPVAEQQTPAPVLGIGGVGGTGGHAAPPIRAASEMFAEGGQRLKARPKKAN